MSLHWVTSEWVYFTEPLNLVLPFHCFTCKSYSRSQLAFWCITGANSTPHSFFRLGEWPGGGKRGEEQKSVRGEMLGPLSRQASVFFRSWVREEWERRSKKRVDPHDKRTGQRRRRRRREGRRRRRRRRRRKRRRRVRVEAGRIRLFFACFNCHWVLWTQSTWDGSTIDFVCHLDQSWSNTGLSAWLVFSSAHKNEIMPMYPRCLLCFSVSSKDTEWMKQKELSEVKF